MEQGTGLQGGVDREQSSGGRVSVWKDERCLESGCNNRVKVILLRPLELYVFKWLVKYGFKLYMYYHNLKNILNLNYEFSVV